MTQTTGDVWGRLQRPLLDPRSRFAWAQPVFRELRLQVDGVEQPLEGLFARILYNDADRQALAVGFSETPLSRWGCDVLVKLEREGESVRVEVALTGRLPKRLDLRGEPFAEHGGASSGDAAAAAPESPPAVAERTF